jgi:dimethylamine/trimethylamine dehydrogenase
MDSSPTDCAPSRFSPEGSHEPIIDFVKQLTKRPVVGVGRFTSPDVMVSQVRRGILDLIGGARPSIADSFLPNKINEGREHEIRECIGCNICISSWPDGVPVRCTQNPTAGEEWRRDWHPEQFAPPASDSSILIVGGGPAGLECATTLARRGYSVTIADSANEFGGRLGVDDILGLEHRHVVIATGARWTKMLFSTLEFPVGELDGPAVYTPDDLAAGVVPQGPVVVFDFDNYYLAGAVALQLAKSAGDVTYVTTAGNASAWTFMTNELPLVHRALVKAGVPIHTLQRVTGFDGVYQALIAKGSDLEKAGIAAVTRIGDAFAPGAIVHAVHSGHRYAREFDTVPGTAPYTRDFPI